MKINFEKVLEINGAINMMFFVDEKLKNTKFGYGAFKFQQKNFEKLINEYNEDIMRIRIENALTDEKTKELLLTEKGDYKFSKEGTFAFMDSKVKLQKVWDKKSIEIVPYFCSEIPLLTEEQKDLFAGILYKVDDKNIV